MSDESNIIDYTIPIVCDPIIVIVPDSIDEPIIIVCEPITDTGATGENVTGTTGENGTGTTGENGTGATGENVTGETGENVTGTTGENGTGETGENGTGATGENGTGETGENGTGTGTTGENVSEIRNIKHIIWKSQLETEIEPKKMSENRQNDTSLHQLDILIKKSFKILSFDTNLILTSPNSALFSVIFTCNYGISIMKHISISGMYHYDWIQDNDFIYKYVKDNISNILNS